MKRKEHLVHKIPYRCDDSKICPDQLAFGVADESLEEDVRRI
jgi:hypothetical protein